MISEGSAVFGELKRRVPHVIAHPCICHKSALAFKDTFVGLENDILPLVRYAYSYINASSKRREEFKAYQNNCHVKDNEILKLVSTRWLELFKVVSRILDNREPLTLFFSPINFVYF